MDTILRDWIYSTIAHALADQANLRSYAAAQIALITMAALELQLLHDNVEQAVAREEWMGRKYEKAGGKRPE